MNKTYNFKIQTVDNETLGAWFILSESVYQALPSHNVMPKPHIAHALRARPTILFFHGNAATRAFKVRIQHYTAFSSRLNANVLAVDYRGFADSSGSPSEEGLVRDARAAYEWLINSGAKGEDIIIMGHSLGTGVGARLAAQLSKEELAYRGIVLLSPFSSMTELVKTYSVLGALPLVKPLTMIPYAFSKSPFLSLTTEYILSQWGDSRFHHLGLDPQIRHTECRTRALIMLSGRSLYSIDVLLQSQQIKGKVLIAHAGIHQIPSILNLPISNTSRSYRK